MTQHLAQNAANVAELAAEVIARCQKLATFSEDPTGTTRTFLCPAMHDVHREISGWLRPLDVRVRVDAAGNLRSVYPSQAEPAPRLLIGSHLDTVPNAGAFDGILGVVLAVALLKALNGRRLSYSIEVVGFSEEEGVRFGVPFIGSRALASRLDEKLLETRDARGISLRNAIAEFGLDPARISQASVHDNAFGYLEFHIEQGPVLESLELPLAVVDAIAGQSRLEFIFHGRANHAGTTPMDLRHDALAGAAEWISIVEQQARTISGLVATVGSIQVKPGATNVIAEETRVSLDVRHCEDTVRIHAVKNLTHQAELVAGRRGLSVGYNPLLNQPAMAMDPLLKDQIEQAIRKTGCQSHRMVSGAGHDAMILAEKVPAAMIFLRTPDGISHDPKESVAKGDVVKALECGLHLLDQLASSPALLKRTPPAHEPA